MPMLPDTHTGVDAHAPCVVTESGVNDQAPAVMPARNTGDHENDATPRSPPSMTPPPASTIML